MMARRNLTKISIRHNLCVVKEVFPAKSGVFPPSRSKSDCAPSSVQTSSFDIGSVSDRATNNAAAFDSHFQLDNNPQWRLRQLQNVKKNPVKPHPLSPRRIIPPSPGYPLSFFPPYAHTGHVGPPSLPQSHVLIHDEQSVSRMRAAGNLARNLLDFACDPSVARAGRTTEEIDSLVHDKALEAGAYPSPLNYMGFPKSVCSSINEVVCHGIPDSRPLRRGDIVSFDVSCYLGGVHGDNCATIIIDDIDENNEGPEISTSELTSKNQYLSDWRSVPFRTEFLSSDDWEKFVTARRLVQAALESRDEGVNACRPGGCLSDIGAAIHAVADAYRYDSVRHYRGHGISSDFHCAPFVKHFRNDEKMELLPGMIFTIEPMLTEGSGNCDEWSDGWTVVTKDGGRAAQFEHTVLITETGVEILTLP